jgi:triacylglycerol lipase
MIPILNLVALNVIIHTVREELRVECEKEAVNFKRADQKICATRYPILLVHGVFFRDSHVLNYWGRIPWELEKNGATVRYGQHHSAASLEDCAKELTRRIRMIREETGCDKVNIIAHSKGGLDCRYAISELGQGNISLLSPPSIHPTGDACLQSICSIRSLRRYKNGWRIHTTMLLNGWEIQIRIFSPQ